MSALRWPRFADPIDRPREWLFAGGAIVIGLAVGLAAATLPLAAIVGGAVGLAWLVGVLQRPMLGVLTVIGIVTVLPFAVAPTPGGIRPTFLDLTLTLTFAAWILAWATLPAWRHGTFGSTGTPLNWPIVAMIAAMVAAFAAGFGYGISAEALRQFLKLINSIMFFFTVAWVVRTFHGVRFAVAALIGGGGAAALIGLALYAAPPELAVRALSALRVIGYPEGPGVLRYIADTSILRAIGTSIDPNVFGATLLMTGVLAIGCLFQKSPPLDRRLLLGLALAIALALLLTRSRGSQVGLAAGLAFIAGLRYRRLGLALLIAGAALALGVLPADINPVGHLLTGLQAGDRATQMRLGEYRDALNLIGQYPWFGVGFGAAPASDLYVGVSNAYLLVASQMGLVGLAAFLLVLATLYGWFFARGVSRRQSATAELCVTLMGAVTGALVGALADHHYFNQKFPHTVALVWTMIGLAAVSIRLATKDEPLKSDVASADR